MHDFGGRKLAGPGDFLGKVGLIIPHTAWGLTALMSDLLAVEEVTLMGLPVREGMSAFGGTLSSTFPSEGSV